MEVAELSLLGCKGKQVCPGREDVRPKKRKRFRQRLRKLDGPPPRRCPEPSLSPHFVSTSTTLLFPLGESLLRVHYFRKCFTSQKMATLRRLMLSESKFWTEKLDPSRSLESSSLRSYFLAGRWTAQAHDRPGVDSIYWAGSGGSINNFESECTLPFLEKLAAKASSKLCRFCPELCSKLDSVPYRDVFGYFHLFMGTAGGSKMHCDRNDLISFLFMIDRSPGPSGGFELGGTDVVFKFDVGDAIILDSCAFPHGSRGDVFSMSNRLVGIFVIHKSMMRILGFNFLC